ncbi:hypothetical protein AM469_006512 [Pseudomonas aeruginosa]|nr:hypothetical protein AM469_006512 [Pseudomonas aeruginosa]
MGAFLASLLKFVQHFGTSFPLTRIAHYRVFAIMEIQQALLTSFLKLLQHFCARFAATRCRRRNGINVTFHNQALAACFLQFSLYLRAG